MVETMVDILLTTYNGEKYLAAQLDSILSQTYTDFKIIIRDDGSIDSTISIIRDYIYKYPDKIALIEDDIACKSACKNFFQLVKHSSAEYIMFCDQDDVWLPEKIQLSMDAMYECEKRHGESKPILIYGDYQIVDEQLNIISENTAKYYREEKFSRILVQNYVHGCLAFMNRALCEKIGEYDDRILMHDWWVALIASAFGEVKHIPALLMKYRQHSNNEVGEIDVRNWRYRISKLFDSGARSSKNLCYRQAQALKERLYNDMPEESKKSLDSFLDISQHKSKIVRIYMLKKGDFLKSDFVRRISQFLFI